MITASAVRVSFVGRQARSEGPVGVIQIGLGPIGCRMIADVMSRTTLKLTGAVDIDPKKIGRDVGEVCKMGRKVGVVVRSAEELASIPGEVCILTTVSSFVKLAPALEQCIRAGKHVVSSCEELAYPFTDHPEIAARIDELAQQHGVAVLGTGINPGFLMDTLPILATGMCKSVKDIRVLRHQDARIRRLPFQQKIGAGLDLAEWKKRRDAGKIRHVGFKQSLHLIASAIGWKLDYTDEFVEPVIAKTDVSSPLLHVPAGKVCGVHQTAHGYMNGKVVITLELDAYNGLEHPQDTVLINGEPMLKSTIEGGVHGDISTSAIICNAALSVVRASPGLRTMADIPVLRWAK